MLGQKTFDFMCAPTPDVITRVHCQDVLDGLAEIETGLANIVLIDPPYNIGKDFGNNTDNRELGEYLDWATKWIKQSFRILSDSGTIYIYGFSEILACILAQIKTSGIPCGMRWLVWHYVNKNSARTKFWQRSHESILVLWKTDKRLFNLDDVREPYTEQFLNNAAGKKRAGTSGRFTRSGQETTYIAHEKGALPRDVIKVPALAGGAGRNERFFLCKTCDALFALSKRKEHSGHEMVVHPTQKPRELSKRLILAAKPKWRGFMVVPFAGTGEEMLVGQELGMKVTGFDINPDYVQMANLLLYKGYPQCS